MMELEVEPATVPGLKFHTLRNPDRATRGHRQAAFARVWLGSPFMPWQQLVANVAGEVNPDGTPARSLVVCTVQRQAGKSHLAMAGTGERCFSRPGFRAYYTAQTGGDARDQFLKFADENVAGTPLEPFTRTLRGNGHELMRFPNGSTLRPHPPTEDAMHGKQSDRNDIDEAWAFDVYRGNQLMQAIAPTQLTRPGAQTWIWSAGGTAASTWLAELVARGRAGDPQMAYFELGIPDDLPLDDVDAVAAHHPAVGHTMTVESLRKLRVALPDDAEFARAAGNRWTEVIGGVIAADVWESVRWADPIPDDVPLSWGAARAADGSHTVLAAAALVDGVVVCEVVDVMPAHDAADRIRGWTGADPVAVGSGGPSAVLADAVTRSSANATAVSDRDYAAACARLLDALPARAWRFRRHPDLDAAVRVAARRSVGDGGIMWARVAAAAPIAALESVTLAGWCLTHRAASPLPVSRFAS